MNLYLVVKNNVVMAYNTKKEAEKNNKEVITVTSIKAAREVISLAMLKQQETEQPQEKQEQQPEQEKQEQQETGQPQEVEQPAEQEEQKAGPQEAEPEQPQEAEPEQTGIKMPVELEVMNSDIHYFKDEDGIQKIRNIVRSGEAKAECFASEEQMIKAGWGIMPIDQLYAGIVSIGNSNEAMVTMMRTTTYSIVGMVGGIEYVWDTTQALPTMLIKKDSKWWSNRAKISVKARAYIVGLMNIMKRCSMSYRQCMLTGQETAAATTAKSQPQHGKITEKTHWDLENGVWMSWLPNSHYIKGEVDEVPFIWDISKYDSPAIVSYAGKGGKIKSKFQHSMADRIVARLRSAGVAIADGWLVA